jgi:hypothetical protein
LFAFGGNVRPTDKGARPVLCSQIRNPRDDAIEIKVYDRDEVSRNDLLGVVNFPVAACLGRPVVDEWHDLRDPHNRSAKGRGSVHIYVMYAGQG